MQLQKVSWPLQFLPSSLFPLLKKKKAAGVSVGKVLKGFWRHTEPSTNVSKRIHHLQWIQGFDWYV